MKINTVRTSGRIALQFGGSVRLKLRLRLKLRVQMRAVVVVRFRFENILVIFIVIIFVVVVLVDDVSRLLLPQGIVYVAIPRTSLQRHVRCLVRGRPGKPIIFSYNSDSDSDSAAIRNS